MPSVTLTSNAVSYSLLTLLRAKLKNCPAAPNELNVQVPDSGIVAANASCIVKIGQPDSLTAPTDVTNPESALNAGESKRWAPTQASVDLASMYVKSDTNNTVLYCEVS